MSSVIFRIVDASSYAVLADVGDESEIENFLLNNMRYIVRRLPLKSVTVIETNGSNIDRPGS